MKQPVSHNLTNTSSPNPHQPKKIMQILFWKHFLRKITTKIGAKMFWEALLLNPDAI